MAKVLAEGLNAPRLGVAVSHDTIRPAAAKVAC
jgi:hypothetical protein